MSPRQRRSRRRWLAAAVTVAALGGAGTSAPPDSPGMAETSLFGLAARGRRFVYVFDRSASMAGRPLAAAKGELLASLARLGDGEQFHVIFYNHRLHLFAPAGREGRAVFATEANRAEARRFIGAVRADGGTRHAEPLAAAFRLRPDVVFLLTDGEDGDDLAAADLGRLERLAGGARLFVIRFAADGAPPSPRLATLCERTGGEHRTLDPFALPDTPE